MQKVSPKIPSNEDQLRQLLIRIQFQKFSAYVNWK